MIWLVFAILTAAVLAALLVPLMRKAASPAAGRNAYDRAVFRDQLAELERDVARGAIGEKEAEAARNEISRRLIGAATDGGPAAGRVSPVLAALAVLAVPVVAVPLYLQVGSPRLPDVPLQVRLDNAEASGDYEALLAKVEKHLAENPDDLKGWEVLAPAYHRVQRYDDAARAYENILRLSAPSAEVLAKYAEALTLASGGKVTDMARVAAMQALALDPKLPMARFYAALALKQGGQTAEAAKAFEAFLADSPADAPWRPMLEAELKSIGETPQGPGKEAMDAAAGMSPEDQQAMIRTMVEGLDARLQQDGSDLEGWLKLIRARSVLQEGGKASAAYQSAKTIFKDKPEALAELDSLAKELNVQ